MVPVRALCFLALAACAGSTNALVNALIGTGMGVTAAAIERSRGNCVAACVYGTTCNHETGLCDPLPCRGECREDEYCDTLRSVQACVQGREGPPLAVDDAGGPASVPHDKREVW